MSSLDLTTIISALVTVVLFPLLIDWIKRNWDYRTSLHKEKFDTLTELSDLLWAYHTKCASLYTLTYPTSIKKRSDKFVREDLNNERPEFWKASTALYTGLYCYRSKIQQYYDNWAYINHFIDELIQWVFQDDVSAMDDHFIKLAQGDDYRNLKFRAQLDRDFARFQTDADRILELLAGELRESRHFWYPFLKGFKIRQNNRNLLSEKRQP